MALGDDACIFGGKAQPRGSGGVDSGNLIEQIGKPHKFLVVAQVEAQHRIVDYFVANVDFFGERFLSEMHDGGSYIEILAELVLQVEAE